MIRARIIGNYPGAFQFEGVFPGLIVEVSHKVKLGANWHYVSHRKCHVTGRDRKHICPASCIEIITKGLHHERKG